jgi:monoamine oxidase
MTDRIAADVCVVGAGYAGLSAALRLRRAGRDVVVLEARDRIGGRIWTETRDGLALDRGGAWLGPRHDAMFDLAAEFGVATYRTHVAGAHLLVDGERVRRYTGLIPKISPVAVASIALAQARVDHMAKRVPLDAPWAAPRAAEWDQRSVADWLAHCGIRRGIGRDLFGMAIRGLMTGDLADVSFLHLLFLVRAHGGLGTLLSIEDGAQENLVDGGAGAIAAAMAQELGAGMRLGAPVRTVTQAGDRVVVAGDTVTVEAHHAVVAIPPALVLEVAFDPPLPERRIALLRNWIGGPESKTLLVYDEPFWRADGFSGQSSEPGSASEVTIDASPVSGTPGILASFAFGSVADRVDALDADERCGALLDALARRFGPRARSPREIVETPWWSEEWTRGCSFAHLRPGTLTRSWAHAHTPFGRVHWAGTETATTSHGAMDGAVRSGHRAAAEILDDPRVLR